MLRLISLLMIIVHVNSYDENLAKEYWYLSTASYCRESKIQEWTCGKPCQLTPKPIDVRIFYNTTLDSSGFGAYSPSRNQIMLIFRGTVPWYIKNWISDFNFIKTEYPLCGNQCSVHRGFYQAYLEIQDQVKSHFQFLRNKYPGAEVVITGHSLGGALATHALLDLIHDGNQIGQFLTYGCPRVGDTEFSNYLNTVYSSFKPRITNSCDPVPHLPLISMGFKHINTEVYYEGKNHQICNEEGEDIQCSNKHLIDLNVNDHLNYFDLDQLFAVPLCQ